MVTVDRPAGCGLVGEQGVGPVGTVVDVGATPVDGDRDGAGGSAAWGGRLLPEHAASSSAAATAAAPPRAVTARAGPKVRRGRRATAPGAGRSAAPPRPASWPGWCPA